MAKHKRDLENETVLSFPPGFAGNELRCPVPRSVITGNGAAERQKYLVHLSVAFGLDDDFRRRTHGVDLVSKAAPFKGIALMDFVPPGVTSIAVAPTAPLSGVEERFAVPAVIRPPSNPGAKLVPNTVPVPANHFTILATRAADHMFLFDRIEFDFSPHVSTQDSLHKLALCASHHSKACLLALSSPRPYTSSVVDSGK